MKVLSDARGVSLLFDSEKDLDFVIDNLESMRRIKREQNQEYPGVFILHDKRMPEEEARTLHNEAWWMAFSIKRCPPKPKPVGEDFT